MSFAFNFAVDGDDAAPAAPPATATASATATAVHHTRHGERFHWTASPDALAQTQFAPVAANAADTSGRAVPTTTPLAFEIVNASDAQFLARTGAVRSILTTSDLQAGVYEGGFKLWECALDLVKFMARDARFQSFDGRRVAELGCGHALPGIYALQRGAAQVTFMDYNKEVLELATCPNVLRNIGGDAAQYARASFYAGAWGSASKLLAPGEREFDVILTAETIYTEVVALELFQTIQRHLRRAPDAVALVAAKKYYFGTGGGVQHFVDLVAADATLRAAVVWEESDGRSNMRAIVEVACA